MVLESLTGRLFGRMSKKQLSTQRSLSAISEVHRPLTEALESRRYCYGLNTSTSTYPTGDVHINDTARLDLHFDVTPGLPFELHITYPDSSTDILYNTAEWDVYDWHADFGYIDTSNEGSMIVDLYVEQNPQLYTLEDHNQWDILGNRAANVNPSSSKFGQNPIGGDDTTSANDVVATASTTESSSKTSTLVALGLAVIPAAMMMVKSAERDVPAERKAKSVKRS